MTDTEKTVANSGALLTPEGTLLSSSTRSRQDLDLVDSGKDVMSLLSSGEFRRQQSTDSYHTDANRLGFCTRQASK